MEKGQIRWKNKKVEERIKKIDKRMKQNKMKK